MDSGPLMISGAKLASIVLNYDLRESRMTSDNLRRPSATSEANQLDQKRLSFVASKRLEGQYQLGETACKVSTT